MTELANVVDWSRAQFALTAMYHWLFVPLTIGLALIVSIMETIYVRTGNPQWKGITKFWMTLFGINFAVGIATGLILEFEFGTNWSNYSWFVGDIFGAPLAIEGIFAFFIEATFVAVMFFGWNKVSKKFHLASTWLVAIGVSLSALWILVANAWMQNPVGMEFDPAQMRNVMNNFTEVAFNAVAMNKFFHATTSGWCLAGIFVVGVSYWLIWRKRNVEDARLSMKVGSWVGLAGIILTMWTGDGSAVEVSKVQPMKLAAMEGLYDGDYGQSLVGFGILNPDKQPGDTLPAMFAEISIPKGLSLLANHDMNSFVPGINDLITGYEYEKDGKLIKVEGIDTKIERGKAAIEALRQFGEARQQGDSAAMEIAHAALLKDYDCFGYGYLSSPEKAVPPVGLTFYAFRIMVMAGGFILIWTLITLLLAYKYPKWLDNKWICLIGVLSIPIVWICSQSGWIVAEVGRQPWVIQNLMPTNAAISAIPASNVQTTFWIFAGLFTALLVAEISIMLNYISKASKKPFA